MYQSGDRVIVAAPKLHPSLKIGDSLVLGEPLDSGEYSAQTLLGEVITVSEIDIAPACLAPALARVRAWMNNVEQERRKEREREVKRAAELGASLMNFLVDTIGVFALEKSASDIPLPEDVVVDDSGKPLNWFQFGTTGFLMPTENTICVFEYDSLIGDWVSKTVDLAKCETREEMRSAVGFGIFDVKQKAAARRYDALMRRAAQLSKEKQELTPDQQLIQALLNFIKSEITKS